ncbi:hypothetical protein PVK06_003619 [Gossypium arboreum]|uniref:RNase H type-1 domain-containing protein n=1 Tax=Gossypium arboreum TaxID=29729 RepID=A0ABR0R6X7_GOSAR|nr:hypothetical protein PVK06_003619 [Gossypium arboreum]
MWVHWNVLNKGQIIVDGGDWEALFSIVTWFIWKNRNEFIFTSASRSSHELVTLALASTKSCGYSTKLTQLVCLSRTDQKWQRPEIGWVKINVDGSVMTNYTKAAVGGTVRDWNRKWLMGFNMVTGMDEIFMSEAAIVEGMKLAWLNGYKQVEFNCDNAMLAETICNGFASISNIEEVRLIHEWYKKDWKVKFRHVGRESNKVADWLAKAAIGRINQLVLFPNPPNFVIQLLEKDSNVHSYEGSSFVVSS